MLLAVNEFTSDVKATFRARKCAHIQFKEIVFVTIGTEFYRNWPLCTFPASLPDTFVRKQLRPENGLAAFRGCSPQLTRFTLKWPLYNLK